MEITIKISVSPEEAKEGTGVISFSGPVPSFQPETSMEGFLAGEIISRHESLPSPDLTPAEPSRALETPMPLMVSDIFPEQVPPEIPMMARESIPAPIAVVEEQGFMVPNLVPDISIGKRSKEDKQ